MKRTIFAQLRTLMYVALMPMLSMSLMACEPQDPGTEDNGGTEDVGGGGGNTDDPQGGGSGGGNTDDPQGGGSGGGNTDDPQGGGNENSREVITIGRYGSDTYCSAFNLDFSEVKGLKAYVATGYGQGCITLTRVKTAKSGEGLWVKGAPGDYEVPVIERSDDNTLNMFVGVQGRTTVYGQSQDGLYANYYWTADTVNTYFRLISSSVVLDNSAYLQIPTAWDAPKLISEFRFDDGEFVDTENDK